MTKYDGPSFYKKDHPKVEPIQVPGKRSEKKVPKYSLPDTIQTREDLQNEAHQYMETPLYKERRFRTTKIPDSLRNLDGWKLRRRNEALIDTLRKRLAKESSDYLLFEAYMKEDMASAAQGKPEETVVAEAAAEDTVNLVRDDIPLLNFKNKENPKKQSVPKKTRRKKEARTKQKQIETMHEKMAHEKLKPNSGLHRSLSNIIAEDKKAMDHWNSNLDSLFLQEKNKK